MDVPGTLKKGFLNGLTITGEMVKVIVPFYLLVELIKYLGVITVIGDLFRPFMRLLGLPGEAALVLIAGTLASMYGALAVLAPLHLPPKDITIIALILGIAHSLPVETPITGKTGVNAFLLVLVRIFLGLLAGFLLNLLWNLF